MLGAAFPSQPVLLHPRVDLSEPGSGDEDHSTPEPGGMPWHPTELQKSL